MIKNDKNDTDFSVDLDSQKPFFLNSGIMDIPLNKKPVQGQETVKNKSFLVGNNKIITMAKSFKLWCVKNGQTKDFNLLVAWCNEVNRIGTNKDFYSTCKAVWHEVNSDKH